jgi:hypothetical protein
VLTADSFRDSKLRGFMIGDSRPDSRPPDSFFHDASATGANIGRTFITVARAGDSYVIPPGTLETIDYLLANTQFPLVLAMSAGEVNPGEDFWTSPTLQQSLISIWVQIATRYKDSQLVGGYDLVNEPVYAWPVTPDCWKVFNGIAQRIYNAIRSVDSQHVIIVCPSPGGIPSAYYYTDDFKPITGTNIVYSLHWYEPYNVTHWGVYPTFAKLDTLYYPSEQPSTAWPPGPRNRSWLEQLVSWPMYWSRRYNIPMFVAEFSCVRWAPNNSREYWLRDSINLFNQYGFSWAYCSWRGWQGWDAENRSLSTVVDDTTYDPYTIAITMLRRAFAASYAGKEL